MGVSALTVRVAVARHADSRDELVRSRTSRYIRASHVIWEVRCHLRKVSFELRS